MRCPVCDRERREEIQMTYENNYVEDMPSDDVEEWLECPRCGHIEDVDGLDPEVYTANNPNIRT